LVPFGLLSREGPLRFIFKSDQKLFYRAENYKKGVGQTVKKFCCFWKIFSEFCGKKFYTVKKRIEIRFWFYLLKRIKCGDLFTENILAFYFSLGKMNLTWEILTPDEI